MVIIKSQTKHGFSIHWPVGLRCLSTAGASLEGDLDLEFKTGVDGVND